MVWYVSKIFVKEIVRIVIVQPVSLLVRVLRFQVGELKTVDLPLQVLDNSVMTVIAIVANFLFIGLTAYISALYFFVFRMTNTEILAWDSQDEGYLPSN